MRIAQVVVHMDVGGVPEQVLMLVKGLVPDHLVTLVCGALDAKYEHQLRGAGVEVVQVGFERLLNPLADLRTFFTLLRLFRSRRFDVVHTHMYKAALIGAAAAAVARVPVVVNTAHNLGFLALPNAGLRALFWLYDRLLFAATMDAVITVSNRIRQQVVGSGLVPDEKAVAIQNGIDLGPFLATGDQSESLRAEFGCGPEDVLIVTVGRLVWFKGLDILLDAIPSIAAPTGRAKFVIVGDGPLRKPLLEQVTRLSLGDRVQFTGERRDVPAVLAAADVFVLPSVSEGLPISILEAMAAAVPVIATDVGGVPELVMDGETGVLVPARNKDALARAISRLAADPALRRRMGERGRERVMANFSSSAMVQHTYGLYCSLLSRKTHCKPHANRSF
jgi:glycosyltransferase involved in cell wall biosynthesis